MIKRHVITDLGGLADHHPHAVIDEEAPADARAGMDLDARQPPRNVGSEARQPLEVPAPQPVRHPMNQAGVESGVAGDDLPGSTGRRVPIEHAPDVFPDRLQHCSPNLLYERSKIL